MASETEPRLGLVPTQLEATPTFPLDVTLQTLFLNKEGKKALATDNKHLSLLSRHIAYLDLNPATDDVLTDLEDYKGYAHTVRSYRKRLFQVSLPTTVEDMGARGAKIGLALNFASNWESSLLVAPPIFHDHVEDVPNIPMYLRIKREHLADTALSAAREEFTRLIVADTVGEMQVNHVRLHKSKLHILE